MTAFRELLQLCTEARETELYEMSVAFRASQADPDGWKAWTADMNPEE